MPIKKCFLKDTIIFVNKFDLNFSCMGEIYVSVKTIETVDIKSLSCGDFLIGQIVSNG